VRCGESAHYAYENGGNFLSAKRVCQKHHQTDDQNADYDEWKIVGPLWNHFLSKSHCLESPVTVGRAATTNRPAGRLAERGNIPPPDTSPWSATTWMNLQEPEKNEMG
jgi:hypothetical protein